VLYYVDKKQELNMKNKNDYLLDLKPVKKYKIPKYPVYMQAYDNPDLLKKLPSRWENNAKVIGCLSVLGALTLTGCPPFFGGGGGGGGVSPCSKCGFSHHGGSGGAPIYVIYLTEQEALSLIREKAGTEGINFNSEPPDYKVTIWNHQEIGLDLYDEEKNAAVALVGPKESGWQWCVVSKDMAAEARKEFAKLETGTTIGVLHNPEKPHGFGEPSAKEVEDAEKILRDQLMSQVIEFIQQLQNQ